MDDDVKVYSVRGEELISKADYDRLVKAGDKLQCELEMERESRGHMRPENLQAIRAWKRARKSL